MPKTTADDLAREFAKNTDHDWLAAIARKVRQYGRYATEGKAAHTLDSIERMIDARRKAQGRA